MINMSYINAFGEYICPHDDERAVNGLSETETYTDGMFVIHRISMNRLMICINIELTPTPEQIDSRG